MGGQLAMVPPVTRQPAPRLAWSTPARLRFWTVALVVLTVVEFVLVFTSVTGTRDSVSVIGGRAGDAATAADLYGGLSDMDAQLSRSLLAGDAEELSAVQYDALRGYAQRTSEVDSDLARIARDGDPSSERATHALLDELSQYESLAAQALQLDEADVNAAPARPPATAFAYYSQATDLMRFQLLPAAATLRASYVTSLDQSFRSRHGEAETAAVATGVSGFVLVVLLGALQLRLAGRFRRRVNPAIVLATAIIAVITVLGVTLFVGEANQLDTANQHAFQPYLVLSQAAAISATAEGDTSAFVMAPGLDYEREFTADSERLLGRAEGGLLGRTPAAGGGASLAERWQAYLTDNARVVRLASFGRRADAVDVATGIARHEADFDFSYYDDALNAATASDLRRFDTAIAGARERLNAWTLLPPLAFGAAALLIPLGIRKRLAEYH